LHLPLGGGDDGGLRSRLVQGLLWPGQLNLLGAVGDADGDFLSVQALHDAPPDGSGEQHECQRGISYRRKTNKKGARLASALQIQSATATTTCQPAAGWCRNPSARTWSCRYPCPCRCPWTSCPCRCRWSSCSWRS